MRNNLESAHETGPKPFPVQRLLFIYLAMLEKHDMRNHCATDIHAQVAELCAMGFLNRVSADGNLDTPKYRCIATFEFSEQLAKYLNSALNSNAGTSPTIGKCNQPADRLTFLSIDQFSRYTD
ncbi:unnamed protein product [Wuchereria bancrofti]|uniref:Origin recognition complex subunit 5 C-terminal domain-containing protein n=1 Tax=Wuchereria bancrofti TaxID=6293 RepID=A0A3P7DX79_WUCBA|nr:unnamed protein product [Wuchereria bancrofti]